MILTRERVRIRLHDDTDVSANEFICIAGAKKSITFVGQRGKGQFGVKLLDGDVQHTLTLDCMT